MATTATALEQMQNQIVDLQARLDGISKKNERVIILVDRSNLDATWHRIEPSGARKPDYLKLTEILTDGRSLTQCRVYYSDIDADMVRDEERRAWQGRQDFYKFLRCQGWILRYVQKRVYDGVPTEKGLDAALITDMQMICREGRCDTIVLVAGDADYCETVYDVRDRFCCKVEVAFFPVCCSRDLQQSATKFVNLECILDKISREPIRRVR